MVTVQKSVTLDVSEHGCGHFVALPPDVLEKRRQDGETFWCPFGHPLSFNQTENARLKAELYAVKQDRLRAVEAAGKARRELDGALVEIGKLHKRVQGGVCPYCKRTFRQMQRHMANKHPERPGVVRDAEAQGKAT